jgi:hypothetical protein
LNLMFHEVALNFLLRLSCCVCPRALETGAYSKPRLHKNKGFFLCPGWLWKSPPALPLVT